MLYSRCAYVVHIVVASAFISMWLLHMSTEKQPSIVDRNKLACFICSANTCCVSLCNVSSASAEESYVCPSFSYGNRSSVKSNAAHLLLTRCALRLLVLHWYLLQIVVFCKLPHSYFVVFPFVDGNSKLFHISHLQLSSGDFHGWASHTEVAKHFFFMSISCGKSIWWEH